MKLFFIEITKEEIVAAAALVREGIRRLRVPKNRKGCIGIVIALRTENDKDKKRLESDLVRTLIKKLGHSRLSGLFHVLQFGDSLSSKIKLPRDAEKYVWQARAHLIIYGDLVQRQIKGVSNYVFRLDGLVVHRPVPASVSVKLGQEFRELLPTRLSFAQSDELLGFEITQQWVGTTTMYIAGIAAMISGAYELAYELFATLEAELGGKRPREDDNPILSSIRQRLNARLVEVLYARRSVQYNRFVRTRDRTHILACDTILEELFRRNPEDYNGKLWQAMVLFFKGKVRDAIKELETIRNKDVTWRYSLGFLYAYNGQIDNALEQYRRAAYGCTPKNVITDTEIFITDVLEREPEKIQLHFFRGLINFKSKPDYVLAKKDFETFLHSSESAKYPELVRLAAKWIKDSEIHLGI